MAHSSQPRVIHIFVSCPGDKSTPGNVEREVERLKKIVENINHWVKDAWNVQVQLWRWTDDAPRCIGPGPQETVDDFTPDYDIYLGIMWARFGSPTGEHESGTVKEYHDALARRETSGGRPIILFFFNQQRIPNSDEELLEQSLKVLKFRKQLTGLKCDYDGLEEFSKLAEDQIGKWIKILVTPPDAESKNAPTRRRFVDSAPYLKKLNEFCAKIEPKGLTNAGNKPLVFDIDELYIPLTTTAGLDVDPPRHPSREAWEYAVAEAAQGGREKRTELHETLKNGRVVIVGDPGAGKSTFLRLIAFRLCQAHLGLRPQAGAELNLADDPFPLLIPVDRLVRHMKSARRQEEHQTAPTTDTDPYWLAHYLASDAWAKSTGMEEAFFRHVLESGQAIVLLDGLDEAPTDADRKQVCQIVSEAVIAFDNCRFVVTSRPAGYRDGVALRDFSEVRIADLEDEAIETFITRWCEVVYGDTPDAKEQHKRKLLYEVNSKPAIRELAKTPVMLTALAMIDNVQKRMPEQRAELYDSVLGWLASTRENRPGRPPADTALKRLRELALWMQDHPKGHKVQVSRGAAAKGIAHCWEKEADTLRKRVDLAEEFLRQEEADSGIIVGRGPDVKFWHRTFQEFLAACAIAGRIDDERRELLTGRQEKLYAQEWREVVLLLAGVLCLKQGDEQVDHLFATIIDALGEKPSLADRCACAGLLGEALRDLAPFRYKPAARFKRLLLEGVPPLFQAAGSKEVHYKVAVAAAEALGAIGDPRFDEEHAEGHWGTIPAGEFWMGTQTDDPSGRNYEDAKNVLYPGNENWESPVHLLHLDAYQIGRYPVTVAQYERFVNDGGYENDAYWAAARRKNNRPPRWERQLLHPNRPVVHVSWFEAAAYAAWMSQNVCPGCRLPTEAEWERAARGKNGRRFPWGKEEPEDWRLNYNDHVGDPTPVGVFPRGAALVEQGNEFGVEDMAGNVWEWCADWFSKDYYAQSRKENPQGPEQGTSRVLRGGAFHGFSRNVRAACRSHTQPEVRGHYRGFRLARACCFTG